MVTQQCKQSKTIAERGWKLYTQLTNLNLNHFKTFQAMELKITALRSPWTASPTFQVSWKSINRFQKLLVGNTQTDRLMIL
jgi:hypothetical protein